jgi:serine/threonine-protein kinase
VIRPADRRCTELLDESRVRDVATRQTRELGPGGQTTVRREDAPDSGPQAGQVLGNYRLLQCIGEGGMGRVFLAEHLRIHRRVAVKVLRGDLVAKRRVVARFFREAEIVNQIRHRNIVDITDLVELDDGLCFIVMELLEGRPLSLVMREEAPLDAARIADIMVPVCDALAAAHRVGVVHRDLKPANIFLCEVAGGGAGVKLLDFGVAKLIGAASINDSGNSVITALGAVVGTPAYMAPEQWRGESLDGRSDIYSLGAIMFELITARPFVSVRSGLDWQISEAELGLRGGVAGSELLLRRVIARCLRNQPAERYGSAEELGAALQALVSVPEPPALQVAVGRSSRASRLVLPTAFAVAMAVGAAMARLGPERGAQGSGEPTGAVPAPVLPEPVAPAAVPLQEGEPAPVPGAESTEAAPQVPAPAAPNAVPVVDRPGPPGAALGAGQVAPAGAALVVGGDAIAVLPERSAAELSGIPEPTAAPRPARLREEVHRSRPGLEERTSETVDPDRASALVEEIAADTPEPAPRPPERSRGRRGTGPVDPGVTKNPFGD